MSGQSPASELARLKVQYPEWRIDRIDVESASGPGWTSYSAVERETGRTLTAGTSGELEARLISAAGH
jgi:hypothetical protein